MAALLKKRALAEYSQTIQEPSKVPTKKLRLIKKALSNSSVSAYVGLLEKAKTSNEALQALLRISDSDYDEVDLNEVIRKLSEHFKTETEAAGRVKILSMFAEIGLETTADSIYIIDETISLLKTETSHKVLAQGILTCLKLGREHVTNTNVIQKLLSFAQENIKDTSHAVKCRCLELIGTLLPNEQDEQSKKLLKLITNYTHSQDARVRSQSFATMIKLHNRGFQLDVDIYNGVCLALKDDYEIVRREALYLVWLLGNTYPEKLIMLPDSDQPIRLIDDAFGKVCSAVTDLTVRVRAEACKLLGSMQSVSSRFLQQTLDKKLMSNMRKKRTAHERAWENVTSGEWASGKKWADDAPRELIDATTVNLMSSGACGALVHGLEDEFLEVRTAAVESLCHLSLNNSIFANIAIDFLVDMFNDEIEGVRLKAIDSLTRISKHIVLREDQLETILGALEDYSIDVREGLHRMLASCKLATSTCLQMCVSKLLDNLRKYPCDKRSTWRLLQRCGTQHPELTLPLTPQLLNTHPFFDTPEPDVEDPSYICILILILNAARHCSTILPLLESHTLRHYRYLRDTMPTLVPALTIQHRSAFETFGEKTDDTNTANFLETIITNIDNVGASSRVRITLLESAQKHLLRLAEMESGVAGAAHFTALHIGAQLLADRIGKMDNFHVSAQTNHSLINELLLHCAKLRHLFLNLTDFEKASVNQLRLHALALQLVLVVRGSNVSALSLCQHFIQAVVETERMLATMSIKPDPLIAQIINELSNVEDPKPGTVARLLHPLLRNFEPKTPPKPRSEIKMCKAKILQPSGENDSALKFTAGLIVSVPFEAELLNLNDRGTLRIKVKYPDQQIQMTVPRVADLRSLDLDLCEENNFRLLTQVLLSHQVWSEACNVAVSLAIAVPESDSGPPGLKRPSQAPPDPNVIDLCKPVNIYVAPKPVRKGI
ncbi:integrator complex subunit 4 [Chrysoperla carnea]|uniref:integrator complex subunit 4 n=1 Tax=Chrysoperla carnea TaxID=189513 RepID=UPI001D071C63|nr:integrator complex subunit 4 [Chrysoperla carnea]